MAKLVPVENVSKLIAGCSGSDSLSLLDSVLLLATTVLAGVIGTTFEAATGVVNRFLLTDRDVLQQGDVPLMLKLTHGFIDQTTTAVVVESKGSWDTDTWEVVPPEDYIIDDVAGIVSVMKHPDLNQILVRVTYDHGFAERNDTVGKYLKDIPDWLVSAAQLLSMHLYDVALSAKSSKVKTTPIDRLPPMVGTMVQPYVRRGSGTITPL